MSVAAESKFFYINGKGEEMSLPRMRDIVFDCSNHIEVLQGMIQRHYDEAYCMGNNGVMLVLLSSFATLNGRLMEICVPFSSCSAPLRRYIFYFTDL
jgi:hypothetical protein